MDMRGEQPGRTEQQCIAQEQMLAQSSGLSLTVSEGSARICVESSSNQARYSSLADFEKIWVSERDEACRILQHAISTTRNIRDDARATIKETLRARRSMAEMVSRVNAFLAQLFHIQGRQDFRHAKYLKGTVQM
ncbi:MAG: hypothetical protein M1814_002588 [Vezdaea aestivalis]|nr:MAG: hypothetical protein M1814_002588 [Vezdaea aestivalis]